jgi:ferredoxin
MALSRKDFFQIALSACISGAIFAVFRASRAKALPRPPGAIVEDEFLRHCARCYRCIDVCEPMALHSASIFDGIANIGTPIMDVSKCIICMECLRVCPTGAIRKVPKAEVDIGTAVIDEKICWAWLRKKRCKICFKKCPLDAVEMKKRRFPVLIAEKCNGCAICIRQCPTDPKSITLSYEGAKRFDPPEKRWTLRLEDRVEPYEIPPPNYRTWFINRIRKILEHYGVMARQV